jgi:hypothetical protein
MKFFFYFNFSNFVQKHKTFFQNKNTSLRSQKAKGKAEAIRMKKKLEADVVELEMSLEHANAAN